MSVMQFLKVHASANFTCSIQQIHDDAPYAGDELISACLHKVCYSLHDHDYNGTEIHLVGCRVKVS